MRWRGKVPTVAAVLIGTALLLLTLSVAVAVTNVPRTDLADDTPAGLEAKSRFHNAVSLKLKDPNKTQAVNSAVKALPEVAGTEVDAAAGRLTAFPAKNRLPLGAISQLAASQKWDLAELHLESGRLDEVFRTVTGGASA